MAILIVDDERITLDIIHRALRIHSYDVIKASSVKEALKVLADNNVNIDMIITDYYMPGLTGLDLIKKIRSEDFLLPVIIMTAYADKDLVIKAWRNRCDGFIEKPFTLDILFAEINRVKRAVSQKVSHNTKEPLQSAPNLLELPSQIKVDELKKPFPISQDYLPSTQKKENAMCYRQQVVKNSQDHLPPMPKMEIIGTPAGRIVHDLDKQFQAIQGQVDLLLLQKTQANPEYAELQRIDEAARRGVKLVEQLLSL